MIFANKNNNIHVPEASEALERIDASDGEPGRPVGEAGRWLEGEVGRDISVGLAMNVDASDEADTRRRLGLFGRARARLRMFSSCFMTAARQSPVAARRRPPPVAGPFAAAAAARPSRRRPG